LPRQGRARPKPAKTPTGIHKPESIGKPRNDHPLTDIVTTIDTEHWNLMNALRYTILRSFGHVYENQQEEWAKKTLEALNKVYNFELALMEGGGKPGEQKGGFDLLMEHLNPARWTDPQPTQETEANKSGQTDETPNENITEKTNAPDTEEKETDETPNENITENTNAPDTEEKDKTGEENENEKESEETKDESNHEDNK
jgi:hypothetical protein